MLRPEWRETPPLGDTCRVFRSAATPVPPHRASVVARAELLTNPSIVTSVLILHNHPSGDPAPSPEDMELTRRLAAAGVRMGLDVIDHVGLDDVRYWSFKEAGRL